MPAKIQAKIARSSTQHRRRSVEFWEGFDNRDNLLVNPNLYQSVIDSVVSDDILMMEIEVPLHGLDEFGLMTECELGTSPSIVSEHHEQQPEVDNNDEEDEFDIFLQDDVDDDDETPRTPSSRQGRVVEFDASLIHEITPDMPPPPTVDVVSLVELHLSCQRTLQKLANSMRRSDATRAIVKRQRLETPAAATATGTSGSDSENFFNSSRARERAETRRALYQEINMGTL